MKANVKNITLTGYRYILIATANILLLLVGVCSVLADFAEFCGIICNGTQKLYFYIRAEWKYLAYEYAPVIKYLITETMNFRAEICRENRTGEYA